MWRNITSSLKISNLSVSDDIYQNDNKKFADSFWIYARAFAPFKTFIVKHSSGKNNFCNPKLFYRYLSND